MKVSDYIAKRLAEHGVGHVFMVSGGGAMHLNDSFGKRFEYICNHHEQACAMAAEGYARLNQKLAVVNVTTGPGGINTLNGVFGQWTDSVPVLYISGQVKQETTINNYPTLRQLGDQETDIISLVKPITKYAKQITDPLETGKILDEAIFHATTGRKGPVWIDVPMDVQASCHPKEQLNCDVRISSKILTGCSSPQNDGQCNDNISTFLQTAKSPLIVAGHGIRLAGAEKEFRQFIEKLEIPVVTTFNGMDIIEETHPLYIGRIGTIGQRRGNFALQNADTILFLGTRNNIRQISYNWDNFAPNAKKIVVDIDGAELDKPTMKPDMKIHADLKEFLKCHSEFISESVPLKKMKNNVGQILNRVQDEMERINDNSTNWLNWCQQLKTELHPARDFAQTDGVNPYAFMESLTNKMNPHDVLVASNGSASVCTFQAGIVKQGQRFIFNSGCASMGYGLPASIGACIANNKQSTICIEGDGSIMMNLQELQTVKHYNLPIKIFILNNNGYISIRQTQNNFFNGNLTACSKTSGVSLPDFAKIADAFGLDFIRLKNSNQIESVLNHKGAIMCEVMLDSDYIFQPKIASKKLEDGTMVSSRLDDMFPFKENIKGYSESYEKK